MNKSHPISALALALAVAMGGTVSMRSAQAQVPSANQLPTGGQVVAGQAQLSQTGSNVLQVNQSSNSAIINWQSFNLGSSATVNFVQPTSSSTTLNRVFDNNPSQIFGRITAPGQVFFTNPSGMYFAPGSSVDVGGLTATTHSISDADFMAGKLQFNRNGATGSIVNAGELKASLGGYIALLAPEVRNQGLIVAQLGTVALAAGEAFTLDMQGTQLSRVQVSPATLRAVVDNASAVLAPGGLIILSAQALDHLQGSVVNNSGTLAATGLAMRNGRVVLDAGSNGALNVSGLVLTTNASGTGGDITVTGQTVAVQSGGLLDASGNSGGGTVLVLSDVSDAAGSTSVQGTIRSTAGAGGGNGGQIETSGHTLNIAGAQIDASSTNGNQGHWLLDPIDVVIGSAEATSLVTALNTGTDVTVTTTAAGSANGDITVNSAIVSTGNSGALSLVADRNVNLNAAVALTGSGKGVLLKAGGGITDGGSITTNNGDITLWANAAGASVGGIQVSNNVNLSSSGGAITLGGSANNVAIAGLPATSAHGTALPQGYAENYGGTSGWGTVLGTNIGAAGQNTNIHIDSGGGRIAMAGQSTQYIGGSYSFGLGAYEGVNVNAGIGNIDLYGLSSGSGGAYNYGMVLGAFSSMASKWQTNGGNITLSGNAAGSSNLQAFGVRLGSNGSNVTLENTSPNSGSIAVNGVATGGPFNTGVNLGFANVLSRSGPISVNGNASGNGVGQSGGVVTIGYLAGSDVTTSTSNISFTADTVSLLGTRSINTSGTFTLQPYSSSFTSALSWPIAGTTLDPNISGLTLGKVGNTADITIASATTVAGPINIYGGNIAINAPLTASGGNTVTLTSSGNVTDGASGFITANKLLLLGGNVTLDHASNNVATLAASGVGSLAYTDSDALAIDTVAGTNGISASGQVSVATLAGDLTLAKRVSTSNASSDAVILNAGKSAAAGSSAGGNLIVSGGATVGVGAGGTAKLYSGSVSGSTGLTALVGAGSGRFRYNSDEAASNYVTALATGVNAIYREQPSVAVSIDSQAIIYGTAPSAFTYSLSGNVNGDTVVQAYSVLPTALVAGTTDTSGNYTTGSHALTTIGGIGGLGYSITGVAPGTVTVVPQVQTAATSTTTSTSSSTPGSNSNASASDDVKLITRTSAVDFGGARSNGAVESTQPTQRTVLLQVVREPAEGSSGFALVYVPSAIAHTADGFSFGVPMQNAETSNHANTRVTLPSGEPLPDWLRFDSATGAIVATRVPPEGLPLRLLVLVGGKKMLLELLEAAA